MSIHSFCILTQLPPSGTDLPGTPQSKAGSQVGPVYQVSRESPPVQPQAQPSTGQASSKAPNPAQQAVCLSCLQKAAIKYLREYRPQTTSTQKHNSTSTSHICLLKQLSSSTTPQKQNRLVFNLPPVSQISNFLARIH